MLGDAPNALIVAAAVLTALGIIWRKVVVPVRTFAHDVRSFHTRMTTSIEWVEAQMKPNGGTSLVDKVNMLLQHDAARDTLGRRYGPTTDEWNPE